LALRTSPFSTLARYSRAGGGHTGTLLSVSEKTAKEDSNNYGRVREIIEYRFPALSGRTHMKSSRWCNPQRDTAGWKTQACIFLGEAVFNEHVNAHEIAHQWFGDSVTEADWHHLWSE
jgi:hypothetical protein